jgi:hypothetical protein
MGGLSNWNDRDQHKRPKCTSLDKANGGHCMFLYPATFSQSLEDKIES